MTMGYVGPGGFSTGPIVNAIVTDGKYVSSNGFGTHDIDYETNANSLVEADGDQGVIGWQRSENVEATYRGGTGQQFVAPPFDNQFWHTVWGTELSNIPAAGTITYEFIGGTQATQRNVGDTFGTFDGRLAIDFLTYNAGLEASVEFGGTTYAFASTGGVAAPSMALRDTGFGGLRFSERLPTTANGSAIARGTLVSGLLSGSGASHVGLTYDIDAFPSQRIQGVAAFRAVGSGNTVAAPALNPVSIAPSTAPIASIDMSRWGGAGTGTGTGALPQGSNPGAMPALADLLPPGAARPDRVSQSPLVDREAAIRQVEALMGGAITFGRPGAAVDAQ
jgi:hypothetical protein